MFIIRKRFQTKLNFKDPTCFFHASKHINNNLILLRHAQSFYNVESEKYIKANNLSHMTWDDVCQVHDFNLDINYNSKFIDSDLSQKGIIQCFNLREQVLKKQLDIDLILCSPLVRALKTCRYVFETMKIKKIIIPELTEVLRYACDINHDIEEKKQQFSEFDWSLFPQKNNFWFTNILPIEISETINLNFKESSPKTYSQAQYQILMLLYEKKVFESDFYLRKRAKRVKQIISSYGISHKKIVVISHHYMLEHLLAQGYRENSQPITGTVDEVPNGILIQTSIQDINEVS